MKTIRYRQAEEYLQEAATLFTSARKAVALTGAGISVASGIPDFRSAGGLWTVFNPDEYATIEVFQREPDKAWRLYRELGRCLLDKQPNIAHQVLADLEAAGRLQGIVTQNIDGLHQASGSRYVFEIHGDHAHLQCLDCGHVEEVQPEQYQKDSLPRCPECDQILKPNIVLFGEAVRSLDEIHFLIADCDLLLVIGTSAKVYPAAALPGLVKRNGGKIFEFNMEPALSVSPHSSPYGITDYFFAGDLSITMPMFAQAVLQPSGKPNVAAGN